MTKAVEIPMNKNMAAVLAGQSIEVLNKEIGELKLINVDEFIDTGAAKIELASKQAVMMNFDRYEMHPDDRNESEFCVAFLFDEKDKEYFMTFNAVMEKNLKKLVHNNEVIITCTGEGTNENGTYKKYNIQQRISGLANGNKSVE